MNKDYQNFIKTCGLLSNDLNRYTARIGIFAENDPFKRAKIARIHSLGASSRNLQEREFLKRSINFKKDEIKKYALAISKGVKKTGKMSYPFLNGLSRFIVDNVVVDYLEHNGYGELQPLKQTTIRKKGNNKILQDKLHLIKSIKNKVVEE